jgi:peptide/nickel transport system permease protein
MLGYIIRRLFLAVVTIIFISILSFIIIQLPPGDYVDSYIAQLSASGALVSAEEAANLRVQYGLDQPMHIQYLRWMGLALRGNFGMAMEYNRPVTEVIGDRLALTVAVSAAALIFTWMLALPIGIYSAIRQYSFFDYFFTFLGFIGLAIPNFLLALIVLYVGFKYFDANVGGLFSPEYLDAPWSPEKFKDLLMHLPIPAIVLGVAATAQQVRLMRANLLDEKRKPYVVAARARGVSEMPVIMKYPVRVALNPFASQIPFILPQLVGGSIIVSVVLSLPTVGPLLYKALIALDMFLAGTIILLISVLTVLGSLISDLVLVWIDPRIRLEGR